MSIELHCTKCNKLIRAPDDAGGKHGKCPYCSESVYIPMPEDGDGMIGLAPIDEDDERRAADLHREAAQYAANLGHETDTPDGPDEPPGSSAAPQSTGGPVDLDVEIETFITAMRDSKLDEAEHAAERLKQTGGRAYRYVEGLIAEEMPPQIVDVPPPLAKGFLKTLLSRLD